MGVLYFLPPFSLYHVARFARKGALRAPIAKNNKLESDSSTSNDIRLSSTSNEGTAQSETAQKARRWRQKGQND